MSLLRRIGRKTKLLPQLLDIFPQEITTFIDLFMGSGVVSFAMVDRAKYIIANDIEEDIFNLFMVLKDRREELAQAIRMMPIHETLWEYWRHQEETDPLWRAVRFVFLSNFGYLGKTETLHFGQRNDKQCLLTAIDATVHKLEHIQFMCCDFRQVLSRIEWRTKDFGRPAYPKDQVFLYADPPYLDTSDNYQHSFTEQDTVDLFTLSTGSGMRFAISAFPHPVVLDLAHTYELYITALNERRTLKSRNTEIVITNYNPLRQQPTLW